MKKTKILLSALTTLGVITPITYFISSCNNSTQNIHIIEPSEHEKNIKPEAGVATGNFVMRFNDEVSKDDLSVSIKDQTKNDELLEIKSIDFKAKECDISVSWKNIPIETTKCTFTFLFASTKGWTEQLKNCSLTYTQPTTKLTVTFDTDGGTEIESQSIAFGHHVIEPTEPTKSGYVFGGWFKDVTKTKGFNFETEVITSDTTIYAKWIVTGYEVTTDEWNSAFKMLADTRNQLYFWTNGTMETNTVNKSSGTINKELIDKIIFDGNKHCSHAALTNTTTSGTTTGTLDVIGEYLNDFIYSCSRKTLNTTVEQYDVSYKTSVTELFYNIYQQAKDKWTKYNFSGTEYKYSDETSSMSCTVRFNENKQLQYLQYHITTNTDTSTITYNINLSFNYGIKEFDLPEDWETNKNSAISKWEGTTRSSVFWLSNKMSTGVIVPIPTVSSTQAGARTLQITNSSGTIIKSFSNNDLAVCITRKGSSEPLWELFDKNNWDSKNYCWKIQLLSTVALAEGDQVTFLIKYNHSQGLHLKAILNS